MRIGIDGSNLRSEGTRAYMVHLLRNADPRQHGIEGVTLWAGAQLLDRVEPRPWLERVHVPALDRSLRHRTAWQLFTRRHAASSCDVLFAPGATRPGSFRPYVALCVNMLPFDPAEAARYPLPAQMHYRVLRAQQAHAFQVSDVVIFLNEFAQQQIGAPRSVIIPIGVDDAFRCAPRDPRPLSDCSPEDPFRFLYVSDVREYKHPWNAARAVAQLRQEGMPVTLDLIGANIDREAVRRLEETLASIDPKVVRMHGFVPNAALPEIYRAADAYVFPSTCENQPLALLEPMASALPIASSRTRPMPDILGDAGCYFDAENVASIADVLRELANDVALRAKLARDAYARALAYSWEECADRTFALLAEVGRASPRPT